MPTLTPASAVLNEQRANKQKSNRRYHEQLKAKSDAGHCAHSRSCINDPGIYAYCLYHRNKKNELQRKRRADASYGRDDRTPSSSAATIARENSRDNAHWERLMWVTYPDPKPLEQTATLAIQFYPEDRESLGHDPWLSKACSMELRNTVLKSEDGSYYVHQGLATLLALEAESDLSISAHTWDWLDQQLHEKTLSGSCRDANGRPLRTIVFIHWTGNPPSNPTCDAFYKEARLLKQTHGALFRTYPNESEAWQEAEKLGDIRALDKIAQSSLLEFSYRPKTCFGHGPCSLQDFEETVHKRTNSGCAAHVHIRRRGEHYQLTCVTEVQAARTLSQKGGSSRKNLSTMGKSAKRSAHDADTSAHWFHQEFVPSLQGCEFRVFIATKSDKKGIRGRSGYVVAIAKTAFDKQTQALAARQFLPSDLEAPLTQSDLNQFSLFVFEQLRKQPDSMVVFESLEVGARLDIGVADNGTGSKVFFVNEITRFYNGHYFSHNICAEPKTQICNAFASAFNAYVSEAMRS